MFARPTRAARAIGFCGMLLFAANGAADPVPSPDSVGIVASFVGTVEIVRQEGKLAAAPGIVLLAHDTVVTGRGAWASITLSDGSQLAMGGDSRLALREYLLSDDGRRRSGVFTLLVGILRALVNGGDGGFVIDSQAAVASARSTDFIVEAKAGQSAVFVQEGRVVVSGTGGANRQRVELRSGQGTDVARGQAPSAPKTWGQARIDDALGRTTRP